MSPNGKLVAYSRPFYVDDIKAEAAIIAMAWRNSSASSNASPRSPLKSLTIETESYNIMAKLIQPDLLLVLVGYRADANGPAFKVVPETVHDDLYAERDRESLEDDVVTLTARGSTDSKVEALMLQRRKLDRLAETIGEEAKVFG